MKPIHENPQITSEIQQPQIVINEDRLNTEILRVQIEEYLRELDSVWLMNEDQLCEFFNNYTPLPDSQINIEKLFKNQKVRLIKNQNKIYFGEILSKKKHGKGIALYKEGKIYEGYFYNNQKHGRGIEAYYNGNIYFGEFHKNKKHGHGEFYWFSLCQIPCVKNQQKYVEHYVGQWWGGLPSGQGMHHKFNGDIYKGSFKNGLKHGQGFQQYHNGDQYKGQFVNGLPQGQGQYIWAKGAKYQGGFKQGFRNGYGIWKKGQRSYQGHYRLDQKHGYGIYDQGNGYLYKGNFINDKKHGKGQLYLNNKLIYQNQWYNGQANPEHYILDTQQNKNQETEQSLKKSIIIPREENHSADAPKRNYHLSKHYSTMHKSTKQASTFYISYKIPQENRHHKCGHRNCVPEIQIGKMPKPQWQNPRINDKGPLSKSKYIKKCY